MCRELSWSPQPLKLSIKISRIQSQPQIKIKIKRQKKQWKTSTCQGFYNLLFLSFFFFSFFFFNLCYGWNSRGKNDCLTERILYFELENITKIAHLFILNKRKTTKLFYERKIITDSQIFSFILIFFNGWRSFSPTLTRVNKL